MKSSEGPNMGRRNVLRGLAAAAFVGVAGKGDKVEAKTPAQEERERPLGLDISPEAEAVMKDWGITLEGSELLAPNFLEYNPVKVEQKQKRDPFPGVCLTSKAKSVKVTHIKRDNGGANLVFEIQNTEGGTDAITFYKHHLGIEDGSHYHRLRPAPSYREGRCPGTALVS